MMAGSSERAEQAVNFIGAAWTKSREDDKWYPVLFAFDGDGKRIYFWPPYHLGDKLGAPVSLHPDRIRKWDDRGDARITPLIEGSYYRNALLMLPSLPDVLAHRVRGPPNLLSPGRTPAGRSTSSPAGRSTPTNTTAVVGPKAKNKRKAAASAAATPSKTVRMGRVQPVAGWTPDPHSVPDALEGMKHAFNAAVQAAGTTPHCTLPTNAEPTVPCCS